MSDLKNKFAVLTVVGNLADYALLALVPLALKDMVDAFPHKELIMKRAMIVVLYVALKHLFSLLFGKYMIKRIGTIGALEEKARLCNNVFIGGPRPDIQVHRNTYLSRMVGDAYQVGEFKALFPYVIGLNTAQIIISLAILSLFSWYYFTFSVVYIALVLLLTILTRAVCVGCSATERQLYEQYLGGVKDMFDGYEDIKLFRREDFFIGRYLARARNYLSADLKLKIVTDAVRTVSGLFVSILPVANIVIGMMLVSQGNITTGTAVAAFYFTSRFVEPLNNIVDVLYKRRIVSPMKSRLHEITAPVTDSRIASTNYVEAADINYDAQHGRVLDNFSIKVSVGEAVGLYGPNGCGKTTLLKLLSGLAQPAEGRIAIDRDAALMRQQPHLFDMSIRDNIFLGEDGLDDQIVEKYFFILGINELLSRHPRKLSGGEMQRILLARTIVRQPRVVMLDEPTSAIDKSYRDKVKQIVSDLKDKAAVIISTHDRELLTVCDRVISMESA